MQRYTMNEKVRAGRKNSEQLFKFCSTGYLRLGAMARDKGNFYEASDWFKEALQINQVPFVV